MRTERSRKVFFWSGNAWRKTEMKEGELLYLAMDDGHISNLSQELPLKMTVMLGVPGGFETENRELIRELCALFAQIKVGPETRMCRTDDYSYISFTFSDGFQNGVNLEGPYASVTVNETKYRFELEDDRPFWYLASEILRQRNAPETTFRRGFGGS